MPLEILIDTQRKEGVMAAATLRRMDELQNFIMEIPEYSKPLSVVETVKYTKQAFTMATRNTTNCPLPRNAILSCPMPETASMKTTCWKVTSIPPGNLPASPPL